MEIESFLMCPIILKKEKWNLSDLSRVSESLYSSKSLLKVQYLEGFTS